MHILGLGDLILRARAGDKASVERLLSLLRPYLQKVARDFVDPDDAGQSASDIVQESSMRVWENLHRFLGAGDDDQTAVLFLAWTGEITRNAGREAVRRRTALKRGAGRRLVRLDAPGPAASSSGAGGKDVAASGSSPSRRLRGEEQARQVEAALAKVPNSEARELLRLRFFEGLNLRQAAAQLGLTYEQARERYHLGLRKVGRELKRSQGE